MNESKMFFERNGEEYRLDMRQRLFVNRKAGPKLMKWRKVALFYEMVFDATMFWLLIAFSAAHFITSHLK